MIAAAVAYGFTQAEKYPDGTSRSSNLLKRDIGLEGLRTQEVSSGVRVIVLVAVDGTTIADAIVSPVFRNSVGQFDETSIIISTAPRRAGTSCATPVADARATNELHYW
jgi:hypothetical protein